MTGTADTEAYEFQSIYGLEVVVIPTNRPMIRVDNPDAVFLNRAGKYRAVVAELKEAHARNQPVLVGTTSIEVSELLGQQLSEAGIHHEVLNAKQHERERSEEHTSELQSLMRISYAVFCLKKKKNSIRYIAPHTT